MFAILIFIIYLHQVLYWVWLWQLKEYRIDRFKAGFSKKSLIWQFDLRHWWRPKLTPRAVTAILISLIFFDFFSIILAPVLVAIAIAISSPPFIFWKKILVWRAKRKMKNFKGTVVGITGSYGKSSTKELLNAVLRIKYHVLCTQGNNNSEIGVAQMVLKKLEGDEDFFLVEMGAYKIGEIKNICEIVKPKIGIITGLGDQHLELFGSLENIKKAKYELINSLLADGFGLVADKDFKLEEAKNIKAFKNHVEFDFEKQKFSVKILGKSLIRNVLGVVKVAKYLNLTLPEISQSLSDDFENIYPKLLENNIIDNSYNSSLESFLSALDYLQVWKGYKKVVVTSGFLELGENAKSDWEKVVAAAKSVDKLILTKNEKVEFTKTDKTVVLLQGHLSQKIKNYVKSF
ncbi:UDP-N-acetylmuramoyl-tripeptide--D-alanyl-D-alanine ligase [Candidatus Gottesmanbacteria bacterium]|nr:UDP-N-acetylmuramoyl-tripeptide--D-alanyl-D-alanine ligase [Candidatus Gottesmanbacteria bacterium]